MAATTVTYYTHFDSPIGKLLVAGTETSVTQIGFPAHSQKRKIAAHWINNPQPFTDTCRQLSLYFDRRLTTFDLPIQPSGTEFQQRVWQHVLRIPYGCTTNYGDIAAAIGNPNASRAVGSANGRNPIPIVIPCHRVIGSDGSLTGFGGGLPTKRFLLELENREQLALPL